MSDLVKTKPQASFEQLVVTAMSDDLIRDSSDNELMSWVKRIHAEVATNLQHMKAMNPQALLEFHQAIIMALRDDFKHLTPSEVRIAAQKGSRGLLKTDAVHFSVETLCLWINAYEERKKKVMLKLQQQPKEPEQPKEMTDTEKLDWIELFYKSWLKISGNEIFTGYTQCYDYIKELKILKGVKMPYKDIQVEAIENVRKEYAGSGENVADRNMKKNVIDELERFKNGEIDMPNSVRSEAQKLTVIHWFEQLKELDSSPKEFAE